MDTRRGFVRTGRAFMRTKYIWAIAVIGALLATELNLAPARIIWAIAVMAVLLASAYQSVAVASIAKQDFAASDAEKQAKFVIETKLPKAKLFAELHIAAAQIFRDTVIQDKDAGVLTGRYLAAEGSATRKGSGFQARQTATFTIRVTGESGVALELRADGYVPSQNMLSKGDLLFWREESPGELFYLTATELQASWKVFALELANKLGGTLK